MTETAHTPVVPIGCQYKVRDEKGALLRCAEPATQRTKVVESIPIGPAITYHFWCAFHVPTDESPAPTGDEEMADG